MQKLFREFICYWFGCSSIKTYEEFDYIIQYERLIQTRSIQYICQRCNHER